jgi:LysR family transcriptional regulator (chromosome initiation inhibitor)
MSLIHHNLKAFMAVKTHLTVAAAAKHLHLTQAAVTLRIQALEQDLNTSLFIRSRRGMKCTPAGDALARYCQRSLELEAEYLPEIEQGGHSNQTFDFVIQGPSSVLRNRLIPKLPAYLALYPNVTVQIKIEDLTSGIERLKRGEIDLLICERSLVTKEFDSKALKAERYILVGPATWKGRKIEDIISTERIIDFDTSDTMTLDFLEKYKLSKAAPARRNFINVTEDIRQLIMNGVGYSVLSEETAKSFLQKKSLINLMPGKFYDYPLGMAWHPRKHIPQALKDLLKTID